MYLVNAYKARHGKLPGKQLFKNAQVTAIPVSNIDLLDEAIEKVIAKRNESLPINKTW